MRETVKLPRMKTPVSGFRIDSMRSSSRWPPQRRLASAKASGSPSGFREREPETDETGTGVSGINEPEAEPPQVKTSKPDGATSHNLHAPVQSDPAEHDEAARGVSDAADTIQRAEQALREIKQRKAADERLAADDAAHDEEVARWHATDQAEAETARTNESAAQVSGPVLDRAAFDD